MNLQIESLVRKSSINAVHIANKLDIKSAEIDEEWSVVGNKKKGRLLWCAIDRKTGMILAYVLGEKEDSVCKTLKKLLKPFKIKKFYTDNWGAYKCNLPANKLQIGKENTQKIERKNLSFRT